MIQNYREKAIFLCNQAGLKFTYTIDNGNNYYFFATDYNDEKIDLDHILSSKYRSQFPYFIDSILNLRALRHSVHLNDRPPSTLFNGCLLTDREAAIYESILEENDYYRRLVNMIMINDYELTGAIEEINQIFLERS